MDGMGVCEFPDGDGECGNVTEHIAAVMADGELHIIPLCSEHSHAEQYRTV